MTNSLLNLEKSVFTVALGKPLYLQMACALARSFRLWHGDSDIHFHLVTDAKRSSLPVDLQNIKLISVRPGQYGTGFSPKLHLDKLAPADRSLFIDADCLCCGSLEPAFESFNGRPVSVIGREISDGEWFGDVAEICRQFGVPALPRFNGGIYYLEKGATASQIYQTARELEPRYDEIGFKRLRGHANDEVLVSLAMALHGQSPLPERGDIMNSLLAGPTGVKIDVFRGQALLLNPKCHPDHNPWYHQEESRPVLVHFLGCPLSEFPYKYEMRRLDLHFGHGIPIWLATLISEVTVALPKQGAIWLKKAFRPLFRRLFGIRKIHSNARF